MRIHSRRSSFLVVVLLLAGIGVAQATAPASDPTWPAWLEAASHADTSAIPTVQTLLTYAAWEDAKLIPVARDDSRSANSSLQQMAIWPRAWDGHPWPVGSDVASSSYPRIVAPSAGHGMPLIQYRPDDPGLRLDFAPFLAYDEPLTMSMVPGSVSPDLLTAQSLMRVISLDRYITGRYADTVTEAFQHWHMAPNGAVIAPLLKHFDSCVLYKRNDNEAMLLELKGRESDWGLATLAAMRGGDTPLRVQLLTGPDIAAWREESTRYGALDELLNFSDQLHRIDFATIPASLDSRAGAWEHMAIFKLRALGSAELAYEGMNKCRDYGTLNNLLSTNLVPLGISRGNAIDAYSIAVFFPMRSSVVNGLPAYDSSFTIVAIPRNQRNHLRTFAICTDQVVRVATEVSDQVPEQYNDSAPPKVRGSSPTNWEPLR